LAHGDGPAELAVHDKRAVARGQTGFAEKESDDVIGRQALILSEGCIQTSVARQGELIVLFGHAAHCVKQQQE
jgi:hypothetical protein